MNTREEKEQYILDSWVKYDKGDNRVECPNLPTQTDKAIDSMVTWFKYLDQQEND